MEERRLVKSGMFSYTLALPKDWISRNHLEKGSKIYISEENGTLVLRPEKSKQVSGEKKEHVLSVDGIAEESMVRDLIASYLTSRGPIRLVGKELKKKVSFLKEVASSLSGLEVIEETSDSLTLNDFINIEELIVPDLIRRADNIIRSMLLDSLECLENNDSDLSEAIRLRDKEVNRLVFLVYKCLNYIIEHPNEGKIHGVESALITQVWELNGYLEKIGDEIKRIAILIPKTKFPKKEKEDMKNLLGRLDEFYRRTMTSLYKGSAHNIEVLETKQKIRSECEEYLKNSKSVNLSLIISKITYLASFMNSISRISRYISFEKHMVVKGPIIASRDR